MILYTDVKKLEKWSVHHLFFVQRDSFPEKPAVENSLRILTAVVDGMRYWSQFKDKVSCLFEIFGELNCNCYCSCVDSWTVIIWQAASSTATLDSAVTLGRYGAKNFLMRDGKEVVQCVFYETVSKGCISDSPHLHADKVRFLWSAM